MRNLMEAEAARVRGMMADAVAQLEVEGGDIRCFTAALLIAALELCVEVEGPEAFISAASRMAQRVKKEGH